MKTTILSTVITCLTLSTVFASNDIPYFGHNNDFTLFGSSITMDEKFEIYNADLICSIDPVTNRESNVAISYHKGMQEIFLDSDETIGFMQILDKNNKLVYQLPINSKNISLSLIDFEPGKYQVNLLMSDSKAIVMSTIERL